MDVLEWQQMVTFIHSKKKCRFEAGFLDDSEKIMVVVHISSYINFWTSNSLLLEEGMN